MTREKIFTVPENKVFELSEIIEENTLIAQILGTDEEQEAIRIRVKYDSSQHSAIMSIIEMLEEDEEEQE